jgi:hypothetical protein
MPATSTPEARNLHREAPALIEANRPKVRRPASASKEVRGTTGARKALSPRCTRAAQRSVLPTRGARWPSSGSSTRAGKPKMATPATSSTLGGRATRRRAQRRASTLDGVDATTTGRTARRRRSHRGPACSVRKSTRRASPRASASPRRSSSTTGRRTPACGLTTTVWHVSWAGLPPTR